MAASQGPSDFAYIVSTGTIRGKNVLERLSRHGQQGPSCASSTTAGLLKLSSKPNQRPNAKPKFAPYKARNAAKLPRKLQIDRATGGIVYKDMPQSFSYVGPK